ncbi:alpha/beta fold hydrolase [Acinetobacter sp. NIPH 2699]|uniref:alpha/beta hydrolase n=1 Tax=Acinetobacter sp. NIPH 2699 TaxID=2923433 RepID=UPI001F4ACDB5|nr:alpha/beta fold hydrolase [Acinetobacter sp. NIPH 2699]MCH7336741.1 lipase family protein [Acinetobacter sp. NIPH 2699]
MHMKLLTVAILGSTLFLTACGSDDDTTYTSKPDIPENNIKDPVVHIDTYNATDMSAIAGESLIMTYKMLGINNKEVHATSLVFTPKDTPPVGGWPIVVWAHGTTGVADKCAPSRNATNDYIKGMISQLLAAGYVVVAPDYEGLGEPSGKELHPFLNLKSEAYSITDAVVAARDYLKNKVNTKWVTVGHSQGGQAALGAAQYQSRAKLNYKGTVAIAPASNLDLILTLGEKSVEGQPASIQIPVYASLDTFTALITAGLRNPNPSLQYNQIFKNPTAQIAQQYAETECSGDIGNAFGYSMTQYDQTTGSLNGYGRTQDNFLDLSVVKNFTNKDSQPLTVKISTPITIYQGTNDTTVPRFATNILVNSAQQKGTPIQYITDDSSLVKWDHGTAYVLNIENIVNDVETMLSK